MDVVSTEEKFQPGLSRQWGDFILVPQKQEDVSMHQCG